MLATELDEFNLKSNTNQILICNEMNTKFSNTNLAWNYMLR